MGIRSLFKKYIMPHEINHIEMLQEQALATYKIVDDLYNCFIYENEKECSSITEDEHKTKQLKSKNMNLLLNAFITPIDRESIYRAITQLDWISVSVKHFVYEIKAYDIHTLHEYKKILLLIKKAAKILNRGFEELGKGNHAKVSRISDRIRNITDAISHEYIKEMALLSSTDDFKKAFIHREILSQLKEIGKRLHICANTLQDIIVKID
jgi:uncharacterized protein Yka (UPF0111/DUF47 family)